MKMMLCETIWGSINHPDLLATREGFEWEKWLQAKLKILHEMVKNLQKALTTRNSAPGTEQQRVYKQNEQASEDNSSSSLLPFNAQTDTEP